MCILSRMCSPWGEIGCSYWRRPHLPTLTEFCLEHHDFTVYLFRLLNQVVWSGLETCIHSRGAGVLFAWFSTQPFSSSWAVRWMIFVLAAATLTSSAERPSGEHSPSSAHLISDHSLWFPVWLGPHTSTLVWFVSLSCSAWLLSMVAVKLLSEQTAVHLFYMFPAEFDVTVWSSL